MMTEAFGMPETTVSTTEQRREAKRLAWHCFFEQGRCLTLIGATILPAILFMALQGIYSMLYYALYTPAEDAGRMVILHVANALTVILVIPLLSGVSYVATGIAAGEERHMRDVLYAYSSVSAYFRAWCSILLPALTLASVVGIALVVFEMAEGLISIAAAAGLEDVYGYLFAVGGWLVALLVLAVGLLISGYIVPFFWLVPSCPHQPLGILFLRSLSLTHKRLWGWMLLHLSLIGWLLLSAATVGILLVLFAAPYYLLTVSFYIGRESARLPSLDDEI